MATARIPMTPAAGGKQSLGEAALWRAFFDSPDIAISVMRPDADGHFRLTDVNLAGGRFLRQSPNEIVGQSVTEVMPGDTGIFAEERLRFCYETGQPQSYERSVDLPEGRRSWTTNLIPVLDDAGNVEAVIGTGRIIPGEMDPVEIDQRNKALVDVLRSTAPGLVYVYDPVNRRSIFNGGGALGYKPHEIEEMQDPVFKLTHPDDFEIAEAHFRELLALPDGQVSVVEIRVRHKDGNYRHLACHDRVLDRRDDGSFTIFGVADDVTNLKQEVQSLSDRLSTAQMDERRLIAQELHDSAGQHVVAAELALLGAQAKNPEIAKDASLSRALDDVMDCLKDAEREIRVLSYLMHPPQIDSQGLATVMRSFAMGFGGRAGVSVDVSVDEKVNRAPGHFAMPLLRVLQEALTNVHRHSKATSVFVKLDVTDAHVELTISDDGQGLDPCVDEHGIGLRGMRERIERLGGTFRIESSNGTTVTATVPLVG